MDAVSAYASATKRVSHAVLTRDGDKQYHYDVLGRLTLVESGLNSNVKLAAYRYDALGRLAMQVTYDYTHDPNDPNDPNDDDLYAASNVTKCFYYDTPAGGDGASSPVLPQVVEIKDGSGHTTDQFVWGPAYVDELLLHERDADGDPNNVLEQRLYAAHDTLYSVLRLVDEDGTVVEQYSYSPYGADPTDPRKGAARITDGDENELTPDDSVAEYLYTGRQFDKAVGLNYHRARRLSHNLGRWTRRDPLGVMQHPPAPLDQYFGGASLYVYVDNAVLRLSDPSGLYYTWETLDGPLDALSHYIIGGGMPAKLSPRLLAIMKRYDFWYKIMHEDIPKSIKRLLPKTCEAEEHERSFGGSESQLLTCPWQPVGGYRRWGMEVYYSPRLHYTTGTIQSIRWHGKCTVGSGKPKMRPGGKCCCLAYAKWCEAKFILDDRYTFSQIHNKPFELYFGDVIGGEDFDIHNEWTETVGAGAEDVCLR